MNDILPSTLREIIENLAEALAALERIAGPNGRSQISLLIPDEARFALLGPASERMFIHAPNGAVYQFPLSRLEVPHHTVTFVGRPDVCEGSAIDEPLEALRSTLASRN